VAEKEKFDRMTTHQADERPAIVLYSLQTCSHCKAVKLFLEERNIPFRTVYVDMLVGEDRNDTMRYLRHVNPSVSFPTLTVGKTTIVGFKREEIAAALDALSF
jgi:glutaredoxin-like protein NrdH